MVSKKISQNILQNLKKSLKSAPPPVWMASLCAFLILPNNFAAAEEVAEEETPTVVSPTDENEGNLDYLTLVDSFVTAERIPTSRFDTPANVTVITADEIEANHYKTIQEALYHVTGVFPYYINGSNRTLILVDGVRSHLVLPSMSMIERIEIVKGGGSALYGTDAVGGVINVITKKGTTHETTIDLSFGSWKTREYDITHQGIDGKLNWIVNGSFSQNHPYKFAGEGDSTEYDKITDSEIYGVSFNLGYDFSDRDSMNLYFARAKNSDGQYELSDPDEDSLAGKVSGHDIAITYDFKKTTSTPGFFKYTNTYINTEYADDRKASNEGMLSGADFRHRAQSINYQNGWEFGKHKIIAGFEYNKINESSWYWNYSEKKLTNIAYYLQDTISVDDKWTLIPGVRLDHNSAFGNKFSPKFAANYRADEKTKFFASWGNVFRAPDLNELYTDLYRHKGDNIFYWWKGNNGLDAESGHTETIGVEHDFNDDTHIRASFFNTKMKNYIANYYYPDTMLNDLIDYWDFNYDYYTYVNAPSFKARGFEVTFQQKVGDKFAYDLGYAFTSNKEDISDYNLYSYNLPRNSFYLGLHYQDGPFKANLYGRRGAGSSNKTFNSYNHFVLDINASYDVADWATIYLKYNNLTNKNYLSSGHSPGRFFMAGLKFRF